ncbi:MAG: 2-dehydropantoate 2-reductase [Lachnospiraceae bacterium]|jgi:hypothetical protein|nr:2-dehydropantoate 2-reductase [Lachnospiraceae bacterium]MBR4815875.1 2-dehydropantoate 2-reductase [Lachnospiraceae bacterium]
MNIYIDFDDCLCETARYFSVIAKELFGKDVPYENINFFDLQKSFSLTRKEYEELMIAGHKPEVLLAFDETPGASETVNGWLEKGYNVSVITGRPDSAYGPSRTWLDEHGLERVKLYCLNKYGRDTFAKDFAYSLELEDYYKMHFDYAVEDSPHAFKFFDHLPDLKVLVFDRPWNRDCVFPGNNYHRCLDWGSIKNI